MATFKSDQPVLFVVPGDPQQNTGGYRYVRELVAALNQNGISARVTGLPGRFPQPDAVALSAMNELLASAAEQSWVVLDGLAMSAMPEVLEGHRLRLNMAALIHHPLADEAGLSPQQQSWFFGAEQRALAAVPHVVTTSRYTAERLHDFGVTPDRIRIAEPGVEKHAARAQAECAKGTAEDAKTIRLLCVAQLSPRKAQNQLVEALSGLRELPWQCVLVGTCDRNPEYAGQVRQQIQQAGLCSRITLTGEVDAAALAALYYNADIFVLPSLYEGYGMVIDEALDAGLPVISANGGALRQNADRPGVAIYSAGDVAALSDIVHHWITDPEALAQARLSAESESQRVRSWADTAKAFSTALTDFQNHHPDTGFSAEWLSLRQPADHKARSQQLESTLKNWLHQQTVNQTEQQASMLVDLGTGLGSNAGYLAKILDGTPQKWLLVDQNASLLANAAAWLKPLCLSVETRILQLLPQTFSGLLPADTHLVTASALIDLVSSQWLQALVAEVADKRAALLIVLSYAGRFELGPQHPDDDLLRMLVNQHQHGDKGLGAALGPGATAALKKQLQNKGYDVQIAASDWQLGGGVSADHTELARQLMHGWVSAASQQDSQQSARLKAWLNTREQQLSLGELHITVCHQDLLALPPMVE